MGITTPRGPPRQGIAGVRDNGLRVAVGQKGAAGRQQIAESVGANLDFQDAAVERFRRVIRIGLEVDALAKDQLRRRCGDKERGGNQIGDAGIGDCRGKNRVGRGIGSVTGGDPGDLAALHRRGPAGRQRGMGDAVEILCQIHIRNVLAQRKGELRGSEAGRAVLQLERGRERSAAIAAGRERERRLHGSAARGRDPASRRAAGGEDPAGGGERRNQIGRIDCAQVLKRKEDRHGFARIDHAVGWQTAFRNHPRAGGNNHGRSNPGRVVNHQGKVLRQAVAAIGDADGIDAGGGNGNGETPGGPGGEENAFHVVGGVWGAARDRPCVAEHVSQVRLAAGADGQVEVVVVGRANGAAGRVSPGKGDAEGQVGIGDRAGEDARLAAGREGIHGQLVAVNARDAVKGGAQVQLPHALGVRPKRVVGHVAGAIHQPGFGHGRGRRKPGLIDEVLPEQCAASRHARAGMAGP